MGIYNKKEDKQRVKRQRRAHEKEDRQRVKRQRRAHEKEDRQRVRRQRLDRGPRHKKEPQKRSRERDSLEAQGFDKQLQQRRDGVRKEAPHDPLLCGSD